MTPQPLSRDERRIEELKRETIFSPCRKYRYTLWREIDHGDWGLCDHLPERQKYLMVIGLNPSTADETQDDPTIRRCIGFAKAWGYGALCMTNLFAWRDTLPENMKAAVFPEGPESHRYLTECAAGAGMILAAWGKHGTHKNRANQVRSWIHDTGKQLHCLGLNGDGTPKHPLYIKADTQPILYLP